MNYEETQRVNSAFQPKKKKLNEQEFHKSKDNNERYHNNVQT